jgi:ribosomal protein S1
LDALKMYGLDIVGSYKMQSIESGLAKAKIIEVTGNSAIVELNEKYSTVIDLKREKQEYLKYITEGLTLDLKVTRGKKDEYSVSFSGAINDLKYREILESIGQKVAYKATVKDLINGGYYLVIDGIEVFMPGSLASMNKLSNFDEMIGKTIYVCPINYSDTFKKIVVSHREYLKSLKPEELTKVKYDVQYKGKITGCSGFGIFAEFNTTSLENPLVLTGLIPISEMDAETSDKFTKRVLKDGDEIDFYVKFIADKDGNKIILTKHYINWDEVVEKYKPNTKVTFNIIKIENGVIFGSIDSSRLIGTITNYEGDIKVGEAINLMISKIDRNSKKIFLKTL